MSDKDQVRIIERILHLNSKTSKKFLQGFSKAELAQYLRELTCQDMEKVKIYR